MAALQVDIIGMTGGRNGSQACDLLAERVEFVRNVAGDWFDQLELNMVLAAVPYDGAGIRTCR